MADIDEESEASITEVCIHFHEKKNLNFLHFHEKKQKKTRQIQISNILEIHFHEKNKHFLNKFKI